MFLSCENEHVQNRKGVYNLLSNLIEFQKNKEAMHYIRIKTVGNEKETHSNVTL